MDQCPIDGELALDIEGTFDCGEPIQQGIRDEKDDHNKPI
jgi:hypothetical protein